MHFINVETIEVQWNPSNLDTIGTEEGVLIREVSLFQGLKMVLGEEESVLIREVSLFQGCGFHCIQISCINHYLAGILRRVNV